MTFKDIISADLGVFLNEDEFAEPHDIDGEQINCIVDRDIIKTRSNNKSELYDGVFASQLVLFVKSSDLPDRPVYGQHLRLDGELYLVKECTGDQGMLEITLEANDS